jgi:hypothetical protein
LAQNSPLAPTKNNQPDNADASSKKSPLSDWVEEKTYGGSGEMLTIIGAPRAERAEGVPAAQRPPLLRFVAMGASAIGLLVIVAWLVSALSGTNITARSGQEDLARGDGSSGELATWWSPGL